MDCSGSPKGTKLKFCVILQMKQLAIFFFYQVTRGVWSHFHVISRKRLAYTKVTLPRLPVFGGKAGTFHEITESLK